MNILYAVHAYKPAWRVGGPVYSVSSLAEELVKRGHNVTVFTTNTNLDQQLDVDTNRPVNVNGVEVWYFRTASLISSFLSKPNNIFRGSKYLYSPRMKSELESFVPNVDLVHTHLPFIYPTFAAARSAFRFNKPLIYHQRGVLAPERLKFRALKKRAYLSMVEMSIMKGAKTLIALTEAEKDVYRNLGLSNNCEVIPNGIDVNDWPMNLSNSDPVHPNIKSEDLVILFLGRLDPTKGVENLIKAFALTQSKFPNSCLVIAGPDDFKIQGALTQYVCSLGLSHRVIFLGMVEGKRKKDILKRANLFCLPSVAEGFSMAILEALANETAVLISPGCNFPEVKKVGVGEICDNDIISLSVKLSEMLSDRGRLIHMGNKAREFVRINYSWTQICDKMEYIYKLAIGESL